MTAAEAVDVWRADLDLPKPGLDQLTRWLSADETAKADRFVKDADRRSYAAAHGYLRLVLSRYLGVIPAGLEFEEGPAGKPHLVGPGGGRCDLRFNLSHSGEVALVAVAPGRDVGVDIERIDGRVDWGQLARTYFSVDERLAVSALSGDARARACFEIWTRKEALVKATGSGIGVDLTEVDVIAAEAAGPWTVRSIDAGMDYTAAVAVEGEGVRIKPLMEISL